VVTEFEFRLHHVGPVVQMSLSFWDLDHGPQAFREIRDQAGSIPDDIAIFLAAMNAPPAPFVPQQHQGALGYHVLLVGHGSPDAHSRAVGDLRREAPPQFAFDTPIPYTALQQMSDPSNPWRIRAYEKAIYLDELTDEAIDVIARHAPLKSSPMSFMGLFILGGKYAECADQDTAFAGSRRTRYVLTITAMAPTPELLEADRAWARAFWADLVPHAAGVGGYVNWMSEFEEDRILASYGAEKYNRLSSIKAKYDPDNLFHLNANIRPAVQ
jgi:FAD/FMN-containing dehydrogenase